MYFSKNLYDKFAHYKEIQSFDFFIAMAKKAYEKYSESKKYKKDEIPVVYGASVKNFIFEEDKVIARVEMNRRGVLRDFIPIDWDFDPGEEDKLNTMLEGIRKFHHTYKTPVLIYPTFSYPEKPRMRTVVFTRDMMDSMEYVKAVTFVVDKIGIDPEDDGNWNITHNFNLPVFNTKTQRDALEFLRCEDMHFLQNELFINVTPKVNGYKNRKPKQYNIDKGEIQVRDIKRIDKGLKYLQECIVENKQKSYNFSDWNNFFQFLHSVARAESVESITRDDALYILTKVAGGNVEWERKNKNDYLREFPRVHNNQEKLLSARPLSFYFGIQW